MTTQLKIIKNEPGSSKPARTSGRVSQARKVMGWSCDSLWAVPAE